MQLSNALLGQNALNIVCYIHMRHKQSVSVKTFDLCIRSCSVNAATAS